MGLWPVYFLTIIVIALDSHGANVSEENVNVGTVLFEKSYLSNHCWTSEELIILNSRRTFQDLIPKVTPPSLKNDEYIADLLSYFNVCFEYVRSRSVGKTRHLMLKSLADVMGGYFHVYVLPIIKVSFYAGNVKYRNIDKVSRLLDELKDFLKTNGGGWSEPVQLEMFINVTPIVVSNIEASSACDKLILDYASEEPRFRRNYKQKRKRSRVGRAAPWNDDSQRDRSQASHSKGKVHAFLPYLDSEANPNSIAVPFKDHSLWSLYDKESVAILSKYYEACVNCISSNTDYEDTLEKFNKDFYAWLLESIYPHLGDKKWYPAFGGVLKIIVFLRNKLESTGKNKPLNANILTTKDPTAQATPNEEEREFGTTEMIIIAVGCAVVVWIVVVMILICYKYLTKHSDECSPCNSSRSMVNELYKNVDYCELNTCASMRSQETMSERLKEWWTKKIKKCDHKTKRKYSNSFTYTSKETPSSRKIYKKRKKKLISVSGSPLPSDSTYTSCEKKKYHYYSSELTSTDSDTSCR